MLVTLPLLLWLFHVAASTEKEYGVNIVNSNICSSRSPSTSEMDSSSARNLLPLLCQSVCRPRETLVVVWHEFPDEIHNSILPSCVSVQRCGGFCGNEATVCVPEKNYTVLLQVQQVGKGFIELPFVQHSGCRCRSRNMIV